MLCVRGRLNGVEDSRRPDIRNLAGLGIYSRELRGDVVVEQPLIVRALQQVFEGAHRSRFTGALLQVRASGNGNGFGRIAAQRRDELDE